MADNIFDSDNEAEAMAHENEIDEEDVFFDAIGEEETEIKNDEDDQIVVVRGAEVTVAEKNDEDGVLAPAAEVMVKKEEGKLVKLAKGGLKRGRTIFDLVGDNCEKNSKKMKQVALSVNSTMESIKTAAPILVGESSGDGMTFPQKVAAALIKHGATGMKFVSLLSQCTNSAALLCKFFAQTFASAEKYLGKDGNRDAAAGGSNPKDGNPDAAVGGSNPKDGNPDAAVGGSNPKDGDAAVGGSNPKDGNPDAAVGGSNPKDGNPDAAGGSTPKDESDDQERE